MNRLRMLACVCAAAVMLSGFTVLAAVHIPPPTGGDSGVTEDATASTEKELDDWLNQHTYVGGTLRLTGDITVEGYASAYWKSTDERIIDCGEYVINVTGSMVLTAPNLTIKGRGRETGMIRAQTGGVVYLESVTVEAENDFALWQEEGAALEIEPDCEFNLSAVHFAERPVVVAIYMPAGLISVVPRGDLYQSVMPKETEAHVNKDGACAEITLPIIWDTDSVSETLDKRIRTNVTGSFDGMIILDQLVCTVVFHDRDVVFERVETIDYGSDMVVILDYLLPERPLELMLEYSFDETEWFPAPPEIEKDGQTMLTLIPEEFGMPEDPYGDEILWPESRPPVTFCLSWQENGKTYYSDIVRLSDGEFSVGNDVGGNRGGGTDLGGDGSGGNPGGGNGSVGLPGGGSSSSGGGSSSSGDGSSSSGEGSSPDSGGGSLGSSPDDGSDNGSSSNEVAGGGGTVIQSRPRLNARPDAGLAASSIEDVPPLDIPPIDGLIELPQPMIPTEATAKPPTTVLAEGAAGAFNIDRTSPGEIVNAEETDKSETVVSKPDLKAEIVGETVPVTADAADVLPRPLPKSAQTAAGVAATLAVPLGFVIYRRGWFARAAGKLHARFRG